MYLDRLDLAFPYYSLPLLLPAHFLGIKNRPCRIENFIGKNFFSMTYDPVSKKFFSGNKIGLIDHELVQDDYKMFTLCENNPDLIFLGNIWRGRFYVFETWHKHLRKFQPVGVNTNVLRPKIIYEGPFNPEKLTNKCVVRLSIPRMTWKYIKTT
jgi:hypothetical protein